MSATYNTNFQASTVSVNGANSIALAYTFDGLLTAAGAETLSYDTTSAQLVGSTLGGYSDSYGYSELGELASHSAQYQSQSGPLALFSDQFTVDGLGRTTQKIETIAGQSHTYAYSYDINGRLTTVTVDGATTEQYSYDANGNRLTNGAQAATYDAQDRLVTSGTSSYTYTAAGELSAVNDTATGKVTTFTHDALGTLTGATLPDGTAIGYVLDGQNRRIGKTVNGTLTQGFLYGNDLHPVAELDGSNAVVSRFVYGSTDIVPDYLIKGGMTYRIVSNELGSPRLVVNTSTGQVVQRMDFDAFGRVTTDTNPGFQPFGFGGGIYDRDTGLVHLGSRDYDPSTGRWISKDPKGFAAGDTNLYAYVRNDPVNWLDPDGRDPLLKVPSLPTTIPAVPVTIGDYKGTIGPFSYDPYAQQTSSTDDAMSRNAEREKQGGPDPLACRSHPGEPDAPNPLGPALDDATRRLQSLLPAPFRPDSPPQTPLPPAPWVPHGPDRPYPLTNPAPPLAPICLTVGCK